MVQYIGNEMSRDFYFSQSEVLIFLGENKDYGFRESCILII